MSARSFLTRAAVITVACSCITFAVWHAAADRDDEVASRRSTAAASTVLAQDSVRLCQYYETGEVQPDCGACQGPSSGAACPTWQPPPNCPMWGVDCADGGCGELGWKACKPINWQAFAQGEYVGHYRLPHVPEYRIRVDDRLTFIFRRTRDETSKPYELQVGDTIQVQSFTDEKLSHPVVVVQPDGTITVNLLGAVRATRRTVPELRDLLEEKYKEFYKVPAISVTPVTVNTKLEDLLATIDARQGFGGQQVLVRVTPEGTVQLPAIGSICAHGLTLSELDREVNERYRSVVEGLELTAVLRERAPRYAYVLGEVRQPGRITLDAPTTVMMAIAQAQGWNGLDANMRQVVVFRRGDDWRLMATLLDVQGALYGRRPCPADEIWLNDSDIVVVPKTPIRIANEFIEQVFTRGLYGVIPLNMGINFTKISSL